MEEGEVTQEECFVVCLTICLLFVTQNWIHRVTESQNSVCFVLLRRRGYSVLCVANQNHSCPGEAMHWGGLQLLLS